MYSRKPLKPKWVIFTNSRDTGEIPHNTAFVKVKLERAVDGAPSQIPKLKFLTTPSTIKSPKGGGGYSDIFTHT